MSDISIDATSGDLAVANNKLVLIMGADEVTQRLRARLRMIRGEWFLDTAKGVPYRELIWVKGVSPSRVAAAIKREILRVPGVLELQAYSQNLDSAQRILSVSFTVKVTDGDIVTFNNQELAA